MFNSIEIELLFESEVNRNFDTPAMDFIDTQSEYNGFLKP